MRNDTFYFSPPGTDDAVMHLTFDEGSGSIVFDASGNGHDGTLFNMDANNWINGQFGGAIDFVEQYDRVQVDDFAYGPEFTLSVWFRTTMDDLNGSNYQYVFSHGGISQYNSLNVYFCGSHESCNGTLRTYFRDSQ